MSRALVFILAIAGFSLAQEKSNSPNLQLLEEEIVETDITNRLIDFHPRAAFTHLTPAEVNATLVYFIGERIENDRLAANTSAGDYWGAPRDVTVGLKYSLAEQKSNLTSITYAEAIVRQSSPLGYAYVISGGPGQDHITVVIGALKTRYFGIDAKIYGV